MTLLKTLLAGILTAGLFATSAPGQTPAGQQPVPPAAAVPPQSPAAATSPGAVVLDYKMELLDKDNDGFVSRAEAAGVPGLAKEFDKFDRNRDGKLDRAELEAAEKAQPR
jgi:EF hand